MLSVSVTLAVFIVANETRVPSVRSSCELGMTSLVTQPCDRSSSVMRSPFEDHGDETRPKSHAERSAGDQTRFPACGLREPLRKKAEVAETAPAFPPRLRTESPSAPWGRTAKP